MSFTREHLLLRYNAGASRYAFDVEVEKYEGGFETNPLQIERGVDAGLLIVRGTSKREFSGTIFADSGATGTVEYASVTYNIGTDAHLKACLEATDLEAESFEDSSFWSAQSVLPWNPIVNHEYDGTVRSLPIKLLEK